QLADSAGSIVARYEYDPFGNVTFKDGPEADNNVFQLSTKFFDVETELYYYGYRYYSPALGRWLSKDSLEEKGGINLYLYCQNNSILYIDSLGRLAGDIARSWDRYAKLSDEALSEMVDNGTISWHLAATIKTAMDVGAIFVDVLKFGEGFAEGGVKGIGTDILRGLFIASFTAK
ncbi:MAG: RHS repeat-associated core domain-containing protein, partial [Desulfobacteraceae bacterium]|nr:RHS repeat-associated core domain-containing protein [Desulfobacteraceae bacterium]